MERTAFRHRIELRDRNYEVDWQGIVHNANYLHYFEVGRIDYLKSLGVRIDLESVQKESRVVLVRNEIDYRSPARFDDLLAIYTRVSVIGDTSFTFEGMMEEAGSARLVAENRAVHVWLAGASDAPVTVAADFRNKIKSFEGAAVTISPPGDRRRRREG